MKRAGPQSGKSSPWAFMERFEIPTFDRPDENYLTRWRIIQTPWCSLYLHRMDHPDSRPVLHDHPWSFASIVLRGGYEERRLNLITRRTSHRSVRRFNIMRRDDAHYIEDLYRTPTWTLLLVGKRRRTWGYWRRTGARGGARWTWTEFDKDPLNDEFMAALAARKATA